MYEAIIEYCTMFAIVVPVTVLIIVLFILLAILIMGLIVGFARCRLWLTEKVGNNEELELAIGMGSLFIIGLAVVIISEWSSK